jgi:hypothetical protein
MSAEEKRRRRFVRQADWRPLPRPFPATATASSKHIGTQQSASFSYPDLPRHAAFLTAPRREFTRAVAKDLDEMIASWGATEDELMRNQEAAGSSELVCGSIPW